MSSQKVKWNKLLSYKRGELSQEEEIEIEQWLDENSDKEEIMEFLNLSQTLEAEQKQDWDSNSAWLRFKARYGRDIDIDQRQKGVTNRKSRKAQRNIASTIGFKLAAAAVILVVTGFVAIQAYYMASNETPVITEVEAKNGERTEFTMGDGTRVELNAGSTIRITETENRRDAELSGEAFFDVMSDPGRPFRVITTRSVTEVLGTRFAVNAYPDNNEVLVFVDHGKVLLKENNAELSSAGIELTENQMGIVADNVSAQLQNIESLDEYLGWRNGLVQFNNQPMSEVVSKISRAYGVTIELSTDLNSFGNNTFSGTFSEEQDVTDVLDAITFVFNLDYRQISPDSTYQLY